jgi:hypothetical protein
MNAIEAEKTAAMSQPSEPPPCPAAERLIAACRENCTSTSVLFLLRLSKQVLHASEIGGALLQLCESLGVALPLPERFFYEVKRSRDAPPGTERPVAVELGVEGRSLEGAMEAFRARLRSRRAARPDRPFLYLGALQPTILQLRAPEAAGAAKGKGFGDNLFLVHGSPEAGQWAALRVLRMGGYMVQGRLRNFSQVYEHQKDVPVLGPALKAPGNLFTALIIDWEAYVGRTDGRRTRDDLEQQCQDFPGWFCGQLVRRGLVSHDETLTVVYKCKSRPVAPPDEYKVSAHFIFSVTGTLAQLRYALDAVLDAQIVEWVKKPHADLSDEVLAQPWIGYDPNAALKNGFALPFSKKRRDDPGARLIHRAAYRGGRCIRVREFAPAGAHEVDAVTDAQALRLLRAGAYTEPTYYLVPLNPQAVAALAQAQQNRTAAKRPAARGGGGDEPPPHGPGGSHLPTWFTSAIPLPKGCVSKGQFRANFLSDHPAPNDPVVMQYGGGMPLCPVYLAQRATLYRHRSNTVVVASQDNDPCVYMRCSTCRMDKTDEDTPGEAARLRNKEGVKTQWLALTQPVLASLLELTKKAAPGACTCVWGGVCRDTPWTPLPAPAPAFIYRPLAGPSMPPADEDRPAPAKAKRRRRRAVSSSPEPVSPTRGTPRAPAAAPPPPTRRPPTAPTGRSRPPSGTTPRRAAAHAARA